MSLTDVIDMGQDLEGTGLNQPVDEQEDEPEPAVIPELEENILFIQEPEPSSNVPPPPIVHPPPPGQAVQEPEEGQDQPPPQAQAPIAEELTSNFFFIKILFQGKCKLIQLEKSPIFSRSYN